MPGPELVEGRIAAHFEIQLEGDPALFEPLDAALDDILLQLEVRDAIDEEPAGAVMAVIDRHLVAFAAQLFGCGQTRGPGADDADRLGALAARPERLHPAALPGRVGDVFLDRTDRHRPMAGLFDDAIAFAQPVLRADAAADLRHVVGCLADLIGLFEATLGGQLQPVGDVVRERAVHLAERHAALRAARSLSRGLLGNELGIDFMEVMRARVGGPFLRRLLVQRHEAQHFFGHDQPAAIQFR